MGSKHVFVLLTVGVMVIVTFGSGNCNTQEKMGNVVPIRSVTPLEDSESFLHRDSRSVHRRRRSVLNSTEILIALDAHNWFRRLEGASNMELMVWDNDLASKAEVSANLCIWNHSNENYGQNLYSSTNPNPINLTAAIEDWYNEKPNYSTFLSTGKCNPPDQPCLHYSQVVWGASRKLGCAYTRCPELLLTDFRNAWFLVCNYDPPGNVDREVPFTIGPACTQCASGSWWCNNGLCDQSCTGTGYTCACNTVCQNSATLIRSSCSCSCALGWYGSDCSVTCKNNDPLCDQQSGQAYYYPASYCTSSDYGPRMRVLCPKLCGQCTACALVCRNSGTLNRADCSCSCAPGWYGSDCSSACALVCRNSGTLNSADCSCSCAPGWYGSDCSSACSALVCHNSGTVNSANCSCSCAPGWYGSDCSAVCENKNPLCDPQPGQSGYPPSYCTRSDYGPSVRVLCPTMCGQCQACALVCRNSGTLNRANCSCSCAPGWYGSDCSVVCENKDPLCDGPSGYTPSYCTRIDYGPEIRQKCPKMCGQCQACSALVCHNSGTVNSANCSCSCAPGWRGSDCSVNCTDFDLRCNPKAGENGWPPSYCNHVEYGATVREKCPAMCNQCQAVCVDYDSRCDPKPGKNGWPSSYCTHAEYGNATRRFCPAMCKVCQAGGKSNYDVSTSTRALLLSMLTVWMFRST